MTKATDWKTRALAATQGTQTGAILHCALGIPKDPPSFHGKASITSDGFVMCDFTDAGGSEHIGAFVGSASDLGDNVTELARYLTLSPADTAALQAAVKAWIGTDWR